MKHAIVTGATGFLGRWLVRQLLGDGVSVTAIVRPDSKNLRFLPQSNALSVIACAMQNYEALPSQIEKKKNCVFYHLAWAGVSGPERTELSVQLQNISAASKAVEAAARLECEAFVGLGTIMETEAAAVASTDGVRPGLSYLYGEAKHSAHLATKALAAKLDISHLWPMLTNAYGEYEDSPRLLNTTMRKMLRREPLEFTAGTQLYDFIHVEDVCRALAAIGERGKPFCRYGIGSGNPAPLRNFIEKMGNTLAPDQKLLFGSVPYTGVQLPPEAFSIESLRRDTGFVPRISFEEGIVRTMNWLKEQEKNDL